MGRNSILAVLVLLTCFSTSCKAIRFSKADKDRVEQLLIESTKLPLDSNKILFFCNKLLDTPYIPNTLEYRKEELIVNLRQLDCMTFVENVLALAVCSKKGSTDFDSFCKELRAIRYKDGKIDDYSSRLHYFSNWVENNSKYGIVEEKTQWTDSAKIKKFSLNFMSEHIASYPALKDNDHLLRKIKETEKYDYIMHYIPKNMLNKPHHALKVSDGDIIAITTSIKGLDVVHMGIAYWMGDQLHLIHASSIKKKVIIESKTLYDYLKNKKLNTGIRVLGIIQ